MDIPEHGRQRSSSSTGIKQDKAASEGSNHTEPSDHTMPDQSSSSSARNDVSRLSENLAPMNLDDNRREDGRSDQITHDEVDPLGQHVKEAIATMGRLESLGLQKQNIDIPRCIVLGQQSTGKSSVIEAISGIKTPRDTDTCTCCPLFITMKPSNHPDDRWAARVSLQRDYVLDSSKSRPKTTQEYPGWVRAQDVQQIHFADTDSRSELERLIRGAQQANLCPLEDPRAFITNQEPRIPQCKFCPNVVRIDITEPGLTTLSFFDLPGIISQAESEEEAYTVPLVQNLVAQYVKDKNSLILVTCDLGTDIANSTAAGLAREHGATDRCIGVLTKPDLLPQGTTDQYLINVLDGKRFKLGHDYFVVKNLNKEEIQQGLGHPEARAKEAEFFGSGRWATSLQHYQPRFGTRKLQLYLANCLAKETHKVLPKIRMQILSQLEDIENELDLIPVTPAHSAVRAISDIVLSFSSEVRREIEGEHGYTTWRNDWEFIQQGFHDALTAMKPTMTIKGQLDSGIYSSTLPGTSSGDAFVIDSDDDEDVNVRMDRDDIPEPETPAKKRKLEETTPVPMQKKPSGKTPRKKPIGTPSNRLVGDRFASQGTASPIDFTKYRTKFVLDDVIKDINQSSKSKIPGQIHPKVRDAMILSPLNTWKIPIEMFFSSLQKQLLQRMECLFQKHFGKHQGTELYRRSWKIVEELLHNNLNQQKTITADEAIQDELEGPYIFHQVVFNKEKATVREHYSEHRQRVRFKTFCIEAREHLGRQMSQTEEDRVRKDSAKMAIINKEPYSNEIDLIAEVTAYYNIAARRLHDSICMRIESKFFKQLRTQLREEIEAGLGVYDDEQGPVIAQRLLAESSDRERRRLGLTTRKEALMKGLDCLHELDRKYQNDSSVDAADKYPDRSGGTGFGTFLATPPDEEI